MKSLFKITFPTITVHIGSSKKTDFIHHVWILAAKQLFICFSDVLAYGLRIYSNIDNIATNNGIRIDRYQCNNIDTSV